jgi:hypothetical protein
MSGYVFKSYANNRNLEYLILVERSLIKVLNKRGPKVGTCGTFDNKKKGEEKFSEVRTNDDLFSKQLWNHLTQKADSPN